jgi:ribonuclease MRP protein subunit SNM1
MIIGWEGTLHVEAPQRKRKRNEDGNTIKGSRTMVYECSTCGAKTREVLDPPSKRTTHTQITNSISQHPHDTPSLEQNSITAVNPQSSTRKRAKSKKPGYLQAILASKQASETKSGFDLLDFMKKA